MTRAIASQTDLYPRPSHADWTYLEKYGVKASSGGGRSSARETIGRVAAGAIAEKYLKLAYGVEIVAFVSSVGKIKLPSVVGPPSQAAADDDDTVEDVLTPEFVQLLKTVTREQVDAHPTRCPHAETAERITKVRTLAHPPSASCRGLHRFFFYLSASSAPPTRRALRSRISARPTRASRS